MFDNLNILKNIILPLLLAFIVSFASTPLVKRFAERWGAVDIPEKRKVHDHPIPRMGGLAIFLAFIISVLAFADITRQVQGILIGAVVIAVVGAIDDIVPLSPILKLTVQVIAAVIAVYYGVEIEILSNPNIFSDDPVLNLGALSIPITILWIVATTNSVNLIDGLDGLAVGVSAISSITMIFIAIFVAEFNVVILMAALTGACFGFMPYNLNPAKIFMGDSGALLLGYILGTASIIGAFKFYALISFIVPFLVIGLPIMDTAFSFFRRILTGHNPMKPDRGHFHHRLLDMGFTQKQVVAVMYVISVILGMLAVMVATTGETRALLVVIVFILATAVVYWLMKTHHKNENHSEDNGGKSSHEDEEKQRRQK